MLLPCLLMYSCLRTKNPPRPTGVAHQTTVTPSGPILGAGWCQNQQGELAMKRKMLCTMPLVAVMACCTAGTAEDITVRLTTAQGQDAGTATIKTASHGVIVQLKAKNL